MAMLEVKNLEVYYGVIRALKGISFEVNQGEVIALIGANGAGKTTTLHTLTGLLQAKAGSITFEGKDITKMPAHNIVKLGIAHVPEGRRVFANLTVYQNLRMGAYTRKDREGDYPFASDGVSAVPEAGGKKKSDGGNAVRRRTADAGNGAGADVQPQADRHGRALYGTFTDFRK